MSQSQLNKQFFGSRVVEYINNNGGTRIWIGLGLIVFVQLLFVFDWVERTTQNKGDNLQATNIELELVRSLAENESVETVLANSTNKLKRIEQRTFLASTTGLMAADMQSVIQKLCDASKFKKIQISVQIEKTESPKIVKIVSDVKAVEDEVGDFGTFLAELYSHSKAFTVTSMQWSKRNKRVSFTVESVGVLQESES